MTSLFTRCPQCGLDVNSWYKFMLAMLKARALLLGMPVPISEAPCKLLPSFTLPATAARAYPSPASSHRALYPPLYSRPLHHNHPHLPPQLPKALNASAFTPLPPEQTAYLSAKTDFCDIFHKKLYAPNSFCYNSRRSMLWDKRHCVKPALISA